MPPKSKTPKAAPVHERRPKVFCSTCHYASRTSNVDGSILDECTCPDPKAVRVNTYWESIVRCKDKNYNNSCATYTLRKVSSG